MLEPEQSERLAAYLDGHSDAGQGSGRMVRIISVFGAVLVGLGLILFVASHWSGMGPALRIGILFGAYCTVVSAALLAQGRGYDRVGRSLWFLATLAVGANIFLIGQIFNFSLTFWQAPFLWLLATLAMGFVHPVHAGMIEELGLELDARGNVRGDTEGADAYKTSIDGVYAAGDMRRGQSLVVWAIREGRQCARAVDTWLSGGSDLPRD